MLENKQILPHWVLIAVSLFCFIAVVELPYGFYKLLRWVVCGVAIASAVQLHLNHHMGWVWALGIVALIFNPLIPFYFPRDVWRVIDAAAGASFLVTLWISRKDEQEANKSRHSNRH
jgi:hypothetical protein